MSQAVSAVSQQQISTSLKRELYWLACLGAGALAVGGILLSLVWRWQGALQWLPQAGLIWSFVCYQTSRRLDLNRPDLEAALYRGLGWGNRLTMLRAWMIAATGGFLFQPWPDGPVTAWLPGIIYFAAAVLDRVDGYVARRSGHGSLLGGELDTLSDALGLAVASLLAYGYGQVHWSYLSVGLAYYAFHGGILWRKAQDLPVYPLPPSMQRRAWAGFQMGFLVVALWPLFYPPLTSTAGFAFMLPVLIGFVIDWLIASGHIDREAESVGRRFRRLTDFSQTVLQPALRIVIVVLLSVLIVQSGLPTMADNNITWFSVMATGGFVLTALSILLGIAGRCFGLLLIALSGWYYSGNPMQAVDHVLFCCVVWSMLLGSGRFSLWQEDEHWINRYDGA